MTLVYLPCDSEQWPEDRKYFRALSAIKSVEELQRAIDDNAKSCEPQITNTAERWRCLRGLSVFMATVASESEREEFFARTLPFITRSASCLDALVPEDGISMLCQQESASVQLGRKLVLSLIANAFLCTFPKVHPLGKGYRPFTFEKFFKIFASGDGNRVSSQAAKLRCFLNYFHRMSYREEDGVPGTIVYSRQVIPKDNLPSLNAWEGCDYPLCQVTTETNKSIEEAGSRTLQVDFAAAHIGGGTLRGGNVQEEIRFSICPELIVSMLLMECMDGNEAVSITGFERFAHYSGYGRTFKYTGDYQDPSEKDVHGNFNTHIVAINATNFDNKPDSEQYQDHNILHELNKAYAGYFCRDERGDLTMDQVALRQGEYLEDDIIIPDTESQITTDDIDDDDEGQSQYDNQGQLEEGGASQSMESFSMLLSSNIVSNVVSSTKDNTEKISDYASTLVTNIVDAAKAKVLATPTVATPSRGIGDYVDDVASSIMSGVRKDLMEGHIAAVSVVVPSQTQGHTSNNKDDPNISQSRSSSITGQPILPIEYTDIVVEEALVSGITKATVDPPPAPPPASPHEAEEDNVLVNFSSNLASKLLDDSLSTVKDMPPKEKHPRDTSPPKISGLMITKPPLNIGRAKPMGSPHRVGGKTKAHSRQSSSGRVKHKGSMAIDGDRLDPFSLQPPSSRMSMAWSTTSTRDDESLPSSPTELDTLALRMVTSIDELSTTLADLIIKDAISICVAQSYKDLPLPSYVSSHTLHYDDEKGFTKINNFLHSLQEMGSQRSLALTYDGLLPYSPSWHNVQKSILRAVATGNWGCGAFKGDPQLKTMLQWMVVSACGRPEMKYHTFEDKRVDQLPEVVDKLLGNSMTVGELCKLCIDYGRKRVEGSTNATLFDTILKT